MNYAPNPLPVREFKLKVFLWPPPARVEGPLLGWDKDAEPYVLTKISSVTGDLDCWMAFFWGQGYEPATSFALREDQAERILHWAYSPMSDRNPEAYHKQMQDEEIAATYNQGRALNAYTLNDLLPGVVTGAIQPLKGKV